MRITIISALAGLLLLINPIAGLTEEGGQSQDDWRENYAYNLGVAAMTIGYRKYKLDYDQNGFEYDVEQEGWQVGPTWAF